MNIDTGHLINVPNDTSTKDLRKILSLGYQPIPEDLQPAAVKKLAGKHEAYVSTSSCGKLSKWARGKRKKSKSSRKRNRGA